MPRYLISVEQTVRYTKVFDAPSESDAELRAQTELDENGLRVTGRAGWDKDDDQHDDPIVLKDNTTRVR